MSIYAKVILDSLSPTGDRLTTLELNFQRFILSEFNTHRKFSRNSASSRAIPIEKQIAEINRNPAMPIEFGSNQSGMQAGPPLEGEERMEAIQVWLNAADSAIDMATALLKLGVHKQVTNRLLEPFMWHRVIVSSTEWDNFFGLRISELAQPEIHALAKAMKDAIDASAPKLLFPGEWHTPYIQEDEYNSDLSQDQLCKISAARCGRVSYLTHDGRRSYEDDLKLFDRLTSADPMHASPLEHVARPLARKEVPAGNFDGWRQLRHEILFNENVVIANSLPWGFLIGLTDTVARTLTEDSFTFYVSELPAYDKLIKDANYVVVRGGIVTGVYET